MNGIILDHFMKILHTWRCNHVIKAEGDLDAVREMALGNIQFRGYVSIDSPTKS